MTDKRIRIIVDSTKAKQQVKELDNQVERLDRTAKGANDTFFQMAKVAAAVGAALVVRKVTQYADAFTSLQNQLRQTVNSSEELADVTEKILDVANRSRSGVSATAELYTQLNLATSELSLSQSELLRITETINKSFAVSGKSAQEADGAIRQLSQGLAAGALRGDEFNSVAEGAPEIMRAIARETGKTIGELREFAADGGITTELLVRALENAADVIDKKLDDSVQTLGQSMELANNNMTAFIGSNETVRAVTGATGEAIVFLSENLDAIVRIAEVLAVTLSARLVIQMGKAAAAFIVARVQALASATAMGTLNSAMALLGGPAGVISIAAGALFYFFTESKRSREGALELADSVDVLTTSFKDFDKQAAQSQLKQVNEELEEARRTLEVYIQRQERGLGSGNRYNDVIDSLRGQIDKLTKAQRELNNQLFIGEQFDIENLTGKELQGKLESTTQQLEFMEGVLATVQERFEQGLATKAGVDKIQAMVDQLSKARDFFAEALGGTPERSPTQAAPDDKEQKRLERMRAFSEEAIRNERMMTASLQLELQTRQQIQTAYNQLRFDNMTSLFDQERMLVEARRAEELALLEQQRQEDLMRLENERINILNNEMLTDEARKILVAELREQEKTALQLFEDEKTMIMDQAAQARLQIAEAERQAELAGLQQLASSGLKLLAAFGDKSFKTQKAFAIAESIIAIVSGTAKALDNPYPANLAFAAQVAAQGAALIGTIKSTKPGSGAANVPSASSAGATAAPQAQAVSQPQQQSTVEIRGLDDIAQALNNRDPDEVLPVEYTQRILNSLQNYNRLSGGNG